MIIIIHWATNLPVIENAYVKFLNIFNIGLINRTNIVHEEYYTAEVVYRKYIPDVT